MKAGTKGSAQNNRSQAKQRGRHKTRGKYADSGRAAQRAFQPSAVTPRIEFRNRRCDHQFNLCKGDGHQQGHTPYHAVYGQIGVAADGLPIGVLSTGSFFGELPLLSEMGDQRYRTDTTVLTDSRVAVADPREFSGLVRDHAVVAARLHAMADERRAFIEKVTDEHARGIEVTDEPYPVHVDI